jgi:membrane protein
VLAYFDVSISWGELLKRTARETSADNGLGLAAQLAYYFFLALFPALLFLIALTSFVADPALVDRVVDMLSGTVPPDVVEIIRQQLTQIAAGDSGGLLTFGAVAALWSSSAALVAVIDALNRAYDVEDQRPWWKQRLTAIMLTLGLALFVLVSIVLVVAGPELAGFVTDRLGLSAAVAWTWKILQWPLVFVLIATAVGLVYYFAPDVEQDFVWLTPGAVLATTLWIVGSLGFRVYVVNFGSYNETYGTIGGIMVLLLWLYLTGLAIIVGAEMNAEIEHASPHGKDEGERVPGVRKVIGARAARAHAERQRERERTPQRVEPLDVPVPAATVHRQSREERQMAAHDSSIADLVMDAVRNAQVLVRTEIALAKAEIRDEGRRLGVGAGLLAGAAVAGLLALAFLLTTVAWGLSEGLAMPVWAGFAVVTVVMLLASLVLGLMGRSRLAVARHMPKTLDTLKENAEWIRARTS